MNGKNEIVCEDKQRAMVIMDNLVAEGYVVMMSTEDKFVVINYEWTETGSRNDVAFLPKDTDRCPKEENLAICYDCKYGHCDFEPMKNEEYELPEG